MRISTVIKVQFNCWKWIAHNSMLILAATGAELLVQYKPQAVNEDEGLKQKCTSYNSRSHGEVLLLDSNQVSHLLS